MQLEGREVCHPDQRGQVIGQNVIHVALVAIAPDGRRLHPVGPVLRCVLLEEEFLVDAHGIPLHGERLVFQMGQQHGRNSRVIVDYLALGETGGGIQDFIQVGQLQVFAFDLDDRRVAHGCQHITGMLSLVDRLILRGMVS